MNLNELLAKLEASATYAEYMSTWVRVEQQLNSMRPSQTVEGWREFDRITKVVGPRIRAAEYEAPVNLLTAVQAHRELTASQAMITDFICSRVYASSSLDSVREGSEHQMEAAE